MTTPLVTITIPTYNSEKALKLCLDAIRKQTYKNIEINVIDGASKDNTIKVARKFNVKDIKTCKGSLLEARYEGIKKAKGKYVLILDSDQILNINSVERAVKQAEKNKMDMLAFEEIPYSTENFLEKLFDCDRKLINAINDFSPLTGVIMPRFFNTKILRKAYSNIPKGIYANTGGPDHAVVYYEAWLLSKKIENLPNAVKHIEPNSIFTLIRKFYRWGYTSSDAHSGKYKFLMTQKERFRTGLFTKGLIVESLGSILLLILKGIPFEVGYLTAGIRKLFKKVNL
ncbi:MAG: glycosyltransferase family 2 protein [Candidatus Levybacteria bacterium]|nr:glycosyltransferase family 2 protein [Candidatus Levybacteria bacterium]